MVDAGEIDTSEDEEERRVRRRRIVLDLNRLGYRIVSFFLFHRSVSMGAEMLQCLIVVKYNKLTCSWLNGHKVNSWIYSLLFVVN